jgi:hypothetical protein
MHCIGAPLWSIILNAVHKDSRYLTVFENKYDIPYKKTGPKHAAADNRAIFKPKSSTYP